LVPVELLHVLAVVALSAREAEEALLQDAVGAVPQRHREARDAAVVAKTEEAVVAPPIRAKVRVIERKRVPGFAIGRVILANRAPLALRQVRPRGAPLLACERLGESAVLGGRVVCHEAAEDRGNALRPPRRAGRQRRMSGWQTPLIEWSPVPGTLIPPDG